MGFINISRITSQNNDDRKIRILGLSSFIINNRRKADGLGNLGRG